MSMKDLFSGIAVVIDDEAHDPNANINKIVSQIESANIPVLKYTSLPKNDIFIHFQSLSFLLLDWKLTKKNISDDDIERCVTIPDGLQEDADSEKIEFIRNLSQNCFCPIFIFTNEDIDSVERKLEKEGLVKVDRPSNLFVQSKLDILDERTLFEKMCTWLQKTPSIYVLKKWEKEYQSCKTKLFFDLYSINPSWPVIMWENFKADGANKSLEMNELISRNLHSRMTPFNFDDDILTQESNTPQDELKKILEGERFLKVDSLHKDDIGTGDLFKEEYQDKEETKIRYYLNIRAQCDLLRNKKPEKAQLYCLKGRIIDETSINIDETSINVVGGQFIEKVSNSIVAFLDEGKIIEFCFYDIKLKKWKELQQLRIGRLLPPYINRIQQRYALYMHRQGLPRIPDTIFTKKE